MTHPEPVAPPTGPAARSDLTGTSSDYRVLSALTINLWAAGLLLLAAGLVAWMLVAFTTGDPAATETNKLRLEVIKLAGAIVAGTGGAVGLLLAARRQRTIELGLRQADRAHELQQRTDATAEADATARRITDLYTTKTTSHLGLLWVNRSSLTARR